MARSARMVRSPIFLKIFAWFWLALASMMVMLLVTLRLSDPQIIGLRWMPITSNVWLQPYAEAALAAFELNGRQGLRLYVDQSLPRLNMLVRPYFFDSAGVELTGNEPPQNVRKLAALAGPAREI